MRRISMATTVIWIAAYIGSLLLSGLAGCIMDFVCLAAGLVFAVELVIAYRRSGSLRGFMRDNWRELLFIVPVFRGLRFLRFGRRLKRLLRVADNTAEAVDIAQRLRVVRLFGRHILGRQI